MRKNKVMRLASVLLVLTLLTTSVISGTFAKYTTTGSVADTARVAKFGVVITTSGTLYSDTYYAQNVTTNGNMPAATTWQTQPDYNSGNGISVNADTQNTNVVAPGTKSYGNGMSFGVTGTPEVAVEVKTTITAEDIYLAQGYTFGVMVPATVNADNWSTLTGADSKLYSKDATTNVFTAATGTYDNSASYYLLTNECSTTGGNYFPVQYTLAGETANTSETDKTAQKAAELLAKAIKNGAAAETATDTAYKSVFTDISSIRNANTNLGTDVKLSGEKLTWEWKFEDETKSRDPADTILGDMIAARGVTNPDYYVVAINGGTVTTVTYGTGEDDYTVKAGDTVVANLRTQFNISLSVTQVD